jgi:hypothetical protein
MTCDFLIRYDQDELEEAEFKRHAISCSACKKALDLDEEVLDIAKSLRQPIEAPYLWNRIERSLVEEMAKKQRFNWRLFRFIPALAALFLVAWLGIHYFIENRTPHSGLIAEKTLARVEKEEQEYIAAIQDLEKQVLPKMAEMDLEMVFRYRDRLETIDAQIEQCKEDLAFNPANAHIRRFLMMALHDKKETLVEILNPENRKLKSRRSL